MQNAFTGLDRIDGEGTRVYILLPYIFFYMETRWVKEYYSYQRRRDGMPSNTAGWIPSATVCSVAKSAWMQFFPFKPETANCIDNKRLSQVDVDSEQRQYIPICLKLVIWLAFHSRQCKYRSAYFSNARAIPPPVIIRLQGDQNDAGRGYQELAQVISSSRTVPSTKSNLFYHGFWHTQKEMFVHRIIIQRIPHHCHPGVIKKNGK